MRKLAAVESLGSCTTIATDKTGTLTVNQQTARRIFIPPGEWVEAGCVGYDPGEGQVTVGGAPLPDPLAEAVRNLSKSSVICNEGSLYREDGAWVHHGDAMDVAFLTFGYKAGLEPDWIRNAVRTVATVPFESERMYAAVYYREEDEPGEGVRIAVKGALEAVLPFCTIIATPPTPTPAELPTILPTSPPPTETTPVPQTTAAFSLIPLIGALAILLFACGIMRKQP